MTPLLRWRRGSLSPVRVPWKTRFLFSIAILVTVQTALSLSPVPVPVPVPVQPLLERSEFLSMTLSSTATLLLSSSPPKSGDTNTNTNDNTLATSTSTSTSTKICNEGGLMAEQSVTGAYNQVCMTLPERRIPLASSLHHAPIDIHQEAAASGRTGLAVWNSGLLLVRLLEQLAAASPSASTSAASAASAAPSTPAAVAPTSILELGCGTGLASIAASRLWPSAHVLATDGNPDIVRLARQNIDRNQCSNSNNNSKQQQQQRNRVHAEVLPWGLLTAMDYSEIADLVVGSDLTYNSGTWPVLAETMATILRPDTGRVVYLTCGHEGFNVQAELSGFEQVARQYGLQVVSDVYRTNNVQDLLPTLVSPREEQLLAASGGARVLVLRRKPLGKKS